MVPLLQDLYVRFRYARGSCSWPKMLTWRSYVLLVVGLGFLITLYRAYTLPLHLWPMHPEEEGGPDAPYRHADWPARANAVKQAFAHAYHGYETYAFPEDELLPLTNSSEMKYVAPHHPTSLLLTSLQGSTDGVSPPSIL